MAKLNLAPQRAGYSMTDQPEFTSVQLDGGRAFYRKTKDKATVRVTCEWVLQDIQYGVWRAFWRHETDRGALPFTMDLIVDDFVSGELTCQFVPGTVTLNAINGETYFVTAELEVIPPEEDPEADELILAFYNETGDDTQVFLNALAKLCNDDFAAYLYVSSG